MDKKMWINIAIIGGILAAIGLLIWVLSLGGGGNGVYSAAYLAALGITPAGNGQYSYLNPQTPNGTAQNGDLATLVATSLADGNKTNIPQQ